MKQTNKMTNLILPITILILTISNCKKQEDINDAKIYLDSIGKKYSVGILANLKSIEFIESSGLTDEGLIHLRHLTKLDRIVIESTKITDKGILSLKEIKSLETIHLQNTQVTDTGLLPLRELPILKRLVLTNNTSISEAGIEELQKQMTKLSVSCGACMEKKYEEVKSYLESIRAPYSIDELKSIKKLYLNAKRISDQGLVHLKQLRTLKDLDLNNTKISDAGVEQLKELKTLKLLYIENTNITEKGYSELVKALPETSIHYKKKEELEKK